MNWQTVIALILVGIAAMAWIPRIRNLLRPDRQAGCGNCGGCGEKTKIAAKPLVEIQKINAKT